MKIFSIDGFLVFILVSSFKLNVHCGLLKGTIGVVSRIIDITDQQLNAFSKFKELFNKDYGNDYEKEANALKNFLRNFQIIEDHNTLFESKQSKYEMGVWNHTDESIEDFVASFTGYIGRPRTRIYGRDYPSEGIPDSLNYVEMGYVTKVAYQGYCGGCWAFATTGALEGQYRKKNGRLIKLSEQNLIDCNKNQDNGNWGCNGGNMQIAYNYIKQNGGINTVGMYPYRGRGNYQCKYESRQSVISVQDFVEVESGNETTLMLALAHAGPIAVAIDSSLSTFQNYKSGIYDDKACTKDPNHAVLLVGYGIDDELGKYWLLKNSWGKDWGENGFFRLARDAGNLCNVSLDPVYPIV